MNNEIKINIGCGPDSLDNGFINLDNSPTLLLSRVPLILNFLKYFNIVDSRHTEANWSNAKFCNATRKLPFQDNSVSKIYSSHFLEHVPYTKGQRFLGEAYRILKPHGIFRLVVPDLLWHSENYIKNTRALLSNNPSGYNTQYHDKFLTTIYGAYLHGGRYGSGHCYMYDLPSLIKSVRNSGFSNISICKYKEGSDSELYSLDTRPDDSIYLELTK